MATLRCSSSLWYGDNSNVGAATTGNDNFIYVVKGNDSSEAYRYTIESKAGTPDRTELDPGSGSWEALPHTPITTDGPLLAATDERLYLTRSDNTRDFFHFDTTAQSPATLIGGPNPTTNPATWAAVTDGSFRIKVNGPLYDVTNLNFSSVSSMEDVASTIQTALRAATGANETVQWCTDLNNGYFLMRSSVSPGGGGSITITTTTGVGTDISGVTAGENYLDSDIGTIKDETTTGDWVHCSGIDETPNAPINIGGALTPLDAGDIFYSSGRNELWISNSTGTYGNLTNGAPSLLRFQIDADAGTSGNQGEWPHLGPPPPPPNAPHRGATLTPHNETTLYAFRGADSPSGNPSTDFWKFNIPSSSWTDLSIADPTPNPVGAGSTIVSDNNRTLYATRGDGTTDFWVFDTIFELWTDVSSINPIPVEAGSATISTDGGDAFFYNDQIFFSSSNGSSGVSETNSSLLYVYDRIVGSWLLTEDPADNTSAIDGFKGGSDLISRLGTTIYALQGSTSTSNNNFWAYDLASDAWSALANMPSETPSSSTADVQSGGSLILDTIQDTIYGFRGKGTTDFFQYDIGTDTWSFNPNQIFLTTFGSASTLNDTGDAIFSAVEKTLYAIPGINLTIYALTVGDRAVIESINGGSSVAVDTPFTVLVQATDIDGNPVNVTQDVEITLSLATGSGVLSGTLSGTIPNGSSTVLLSGISYSVAEAGVSLRVDDTSPSPILASTTGPIFEVFSIITDSALSTLSASPTSVPANGVSTSIITATVNDSSSTPIPGKTITLAHSAGPGNPTIKAVNCSQSDVDVVTKGVTNASGQACFAVHSETISSADTFEATVTTDGITIAQTADVAFTIDLPDQNVSTLSNNPTTAAADGVETSTITATITDILGRAIQSETVSITDDGTPGTLSYTPVSQQETTTAGGVADFTVTSTTAGLFTFTASLNTNHYQQDTYTEITSPTFINDYEGTAASLIAGSQGNDVEATTTLPFDFHLFDQTVSAGNNLYVCSNGFISLASTGCPTSGTLQNSIAGFFRDLNTTTGGIYRQVDTDNNSVRFLWDAIDESTGNPIFFEIILYQNSRIDFHYFVNSGLTARIGLYNATGGSAPTTLSSFDSIVFDRTSATTFQHPVTSGTVNLTQTAQTEFTAGAVSLANSTIVADPTAIQADGIETSTITVTILDEFFNPIPGRTIELIDNKTPGQVDYQGLPQPPPYPQGTTDAQGQTSFIVSSTTIDTVNFTATDITGSPITIGSVEVTFTCILGSNQQCILINIEQGTGVLTVSIPDDFAFPASQIATQGQDLFSINSPTPYTLNVNDVVTVTDTELSGGFNLQLTASAFEDSATSEQLPLAGFYGVTQTASTGGDADSGVEYPPGYSGVKNITAPQDNTTSGSLSSPSTFTTHGDNLDTTIDLMLAPVTTLEEGRSGTFKQNVQYYLQIPPLQPSGNYEVTLTFDLTRTAPTP